APRGAATASPTSPGTIDGDRWSGAFSAQTTGAAITRPTTTVAGSAASARGTAHEIASSQNPRTSGEAIGRRSPQRAGPARSTTPRHLVGSQVAPTPRAPTSAAVPIRNAIFAAKMVPARPGSRPRNRRPPAISAGTRLGPIRSAVAKTPTNAIVPGSAALL